MSQPVRVRLARLGRRGLTALAASGAVLSACAASAGDLARASCAHVNPSITLLHQASRTTDAAEAATLNERAYIQLLQAIPIAAQAAYHDIQWQSLATTLSEANRVPESHAVARPAGPVPATPMPRCSASPAPVLDREQPGRLTGCRAVRPAAHRVRAARPRWWVPGPR